MFYMRYLITGLPCTSEVSSYTEYIIHFPKDDDPFLFMNKEKQ